MEERNLIMARMLGPIGQPFCGKHCGWQTKADNQKEKRRTKRREKAELRRDLIAGRV